MSKQLLVDTDVAIDFLRGQTQAAALFKAESDRIGFSAVTVAEIYSGIKDVREEAEVERLFAIFPVFPITGEIARVAGQYVRQYGKTYSIEIPDALIAATCSVHQSELSTMNIRHYPMFKGLTPPYKKA